MRLLVKGMKSPIKLKLDYDSRQPLKTPGSHEEIDLKIFLSYTDKKPSFDNYDKRYLNKPKFITIYAINEATGHKMGAFTNQFVHLGFVSEIGGYIAVTFFGMQKEKSKNFIRIPTSNILKIEDMGEDIEISVNDPFFKDLIDAQENHKKR